MPTFTSLRQYRKAWKKRIRKIEKGADSASSKSSRLMVAEAKLRAPRKSGATIRGIRRRKTKLGYKVESWVPGMFKQNLFANRQPPFAVLNFTTKSIQPFFAIPQTVVYGNRAISPSGNIIRWTGVVIRGQGFWTLAFNKVKRKFPKMVIENTRKALRVSV